VSHYFTRPDENGYSIYFFYDYGTEEAHVTGMMREAAERALELAGQPIRYDHRQLKLDL